MGIRNVPSPWQTPEPIGSPSRNNITINDGTTTVQLPTTSTWFEVLNTVSGSGVVITGEPGGRTAGTRADTS